LLAVYPAGRPQDVIVLDGLVTKEQVLAAIQKAGPSKSAQANGSPSTGQVKPVSFEPPASLTQP
jgi:hypothetical protein